MSDLNLLRIMLERKQFSSSYKSIPLTTYDANTVGMLKWFDAYFKAYETHEVIDLHTLESFIKLKAKNSTAESTALTKSLLKQLALPCPDEIRPVIIASLEERRLAARAAMLLQQFEDGGEVDIIFELNKISNEAKQRVGLETQASWCDTDVWELIQADADDAGYKLDFLADEISNNIKGINEGNNICVAAPTDKGKTSFLVRLATSFTLQRMTFVKAWLEKLKSMDELTEEYQRLKHKCRFRPVLYLVNEGTAEVITPRVYQTGLNLDRQQLWDNGSAGKITPMFAERFGRRDSIRLVNVHGKSLAQIARIIEAHDPFLVISDMTGRIRASGGGAGSNDVAQLEEVWNDMRTLSAMMNFIHVGTAQISAEGFDMLYPPLSALQNSKTGIQTTLDLALWLGAFANPTPDNELRRGICTPKNKLVKSGCRSYNAVETFFEPELNKWDGLA